MRFFKSVLTFSMMFLISMRAHAQASSSSTPSKINYKTLQKSISAAKKYNLKMKTTKQKKLLKPYIYPSEIYPLSWFTSVNTL